VFAFLFARRVAVAGVATEIGSGRVGGFREDEVAQESVCVMIMMVSGVSIFVKWVIMGQDLTRLGEQIYVASS
jgi:hypothetical protein